MQYNFLNQLMQLYGIGQPLTNPLLKFSGPQFGPQQFEQPQQQNGQPQVAFQPQIQQPQQQNAAVPQQPVAPTTNTLSPQGHFKSVSPNFQLPNFGNKATTGQEVFKPGGKFYDPNVPMYAAPNRG